MAVNKNFVVKNGLEVNTNLIVADATNNKVGIASTAPRFELDVAGGIGATDVYVSGVSTAQERFDVAQAETSYLSSLHLEEFPQAKLVLVLPIQSSYLTFALL